MRPESEADLAEAVAGAQGPLAIRGGGTRGGAVLGEVLETGGLSGITLYEPGALTLVARAGTPLAEIETALEREGQRLAFEPMDHRVLLGGTGAPTVGGVVAANVSGPRRIQAGAARDFCLGVRFVDGRGTVIKNGGRVMKNVTGYDLVKLMAGSWGTLGVLSEVSLKVLPAPEAAASLAVPVATASEAVAVMSAALGSPFDVNGAAYRPEAGCVVLRIEGFDGSVGYRAERLAALFAGRGAEIDREGVGETWRALRDVAVLKDHPLVWKLSMASRDMVPALLEPAARDMGFDYQLDWGGGLCWLGMTVAQLDACAARFGTGDPWATAVAVHRGLQERMVAPDAANRLRGHATLVKAPEPVATQVPRFQPEPAGLAALTAGLRQRFDPRGILNPGLMA